ncbi:MAG: DUF1588 domain-containing protein [Myxococcota bacterium]
MVLAWWLAACHVDEPGPADPPSTVVAPDAGGIGESGVRRLSVDELDNVLRDLLGDERRISGIYLPPDVIDPFDNQVEGQEPTAVVVTGLEALANDVSAALFADPTRRDAVLGCTPASPDDRACLRSFVGSIGRLALRRTLSTAEIDRFVEAGAAFGASTGELYDGFDVVLRALLQHPEFVYRVERGAPTDEPGVFRLSGTEVATRLSVLLWGSTPDAALLDLAEAGGLDDSAGVRAAAEGLLGDPAARVRIDRFHAMWLGYWSLPHPPELTAALRAETRALIDDVVFDRGDSWLGLFTADGTFADDDLAAHYGLPAPGSDTPVWVSYAGTDRMGILSHGSFLSVNAKFGDTSPTLRGKLIRERLLCQDIPPPPPTVNVDEAPQGDGATDCKEDRYAVHRATGSCNACHALIDPVGFGLENYDREGRYRTHDEGHPECPISGEGDLDGVSFEGPRGLAALLVDGDALVACGVRQWVALAVGHEPGDDEQPLIDRLIAGWAADDHRLDALLLGLVSDEVFLYRREPEVTR